MDFTPDIIILIGGTALFLLIVTYSSIRNVRAKKQFAAAKSVVPLSVSRKFNTTFMVLIGVMIVLAWILGDSLWVNLFLTVLLLCGVVSMVLLQISVSGVTEEGLFVCGRLIEWFNIHDFYMNKTLKTVIFSNNIKGGLTLKGLTVPMSYNAEDEEKLEQFMLEHHNKSRTRIIIR